MCEITATEFKNNLGYYLDLSQKEDIYITKNNKPYCVLSNSKDKALMDFLSLRGILKNEESESLTNDELLGKAILEKCGF